MSWDIKIDKAIRQYRDLVVSILADIKEPPCRNCKYWDPALKGTGEISYCFSENMEGSFSCFKERK